MEEYKPYKLANPAETIGKIIDGAVVATFSQDLTEQEKAQARENIGAGSSDSGMTIFGYFDTFEELNATITAPAPGAAYGVGMAYPYDIYVWDALRQRWVNNGPIRGADGADGKDGKDAVITAESLTAALGYVPAKTSDVQTLTWENITVPDSAWLETYESQLYPWRAAISLPDSGVDATYLPTVVFDEASRENADLSPVAQSVDDGVYIYAASAPEILVLINTLACEPTLVDTLASSVFASIAVTYEAGATCTCTNGTTTLTAKSTTGKWTFAVPSAGTWTVSDGTNSQTVNITTQGQAVSVVLSETGGVDDGKVYIFKSGEGAIVPLTETHESGSTVTITTEKIVTSYTSGDPLVGIYNTNKTDVDLTDVNYIKVRAKVTEINSSDGIGLRICVDSDPITAADQWTDTFDADLVLDKSTTATEYSLSVKNISGNKYVGLWGASKAEIYDIWLEKEA